MIVLTVRTKLLLSYVAMFVIVAAGAAATMWSSARWRQATDTLLQAQSMSLRAERLRWNIVGLTHAGEAVIAGREPPRIVDSSLQQTEQLLEDLRSGSAELPQAEGIRDNLEGFEESFRELTWIISAARQGISAPGGLGDTSRWRERLSEIDDEVHDEVTIVQRTLTEHGRNDLSAATNAGRLSDMITSLAAVANALILVLMLFMLRRWVTRPARELESVADTIAAGDLNVRLPEHGEREWRAVGAAMHHMTRSLAQARRQLQTQERLSALGEVSAYVAHNIRNPLASIRAMSQAAMLDKPASEEHAQAFRDVINCVDTMERWVHSLLDFAKPMTLDQQPIDINELIRETLALFRQQAVANGVKVDTDLAEGIPGVFVDQPLVEQALAAIVSNAIEATPADGHVSVSSESRISADSSDGMVEVAVADTGCGIPQALVDRVFQPFVTGKSGGNGLGLAQAKKIVDLHLGSLRLESEEGQGTMVVIQLPTTGETGDDA